MLRPSIARMILLAVLALALSWSHVHAQSTVIVDHDASDLPWIRARVIPPAPAMNTASASSWRVTDNGESKTVERCERVPARVRPTADVVLCIDVSNSVIELSRKSVMRAAAEILIERLIAGGATIAIVYFDNKAHIGCDFTRDRALLRDGLSRMFAGRASSVVSAITEPTTGALSMLSKNSVRPSIIVMTDSEDPFDPKDVIPQLRERGAAISFLGMGRLSMEPHRRCADSTGGVAVRCSADSGNVVNTASALASALMDGNIVELTWKAASRKAVTHVADIRSSADTTSATFTYVIPDNRQSRLESPEHLSFGVVTPSRPASSFVSLTAVNSSFIVDSVRFETPPMGFSITQEFPMNIDSGTTANLPLRFAPRDTGFVWTRLSVFIRNEKPLTVNLSGGKADKVVNPATMHLLSPKGGEEYFVDSYVPLSWEGSEPGDLHRIEVTTNGGSTWTVSADSVRGSSYLWHTPVDSAAAVLLRVSHRGSDRYRGSFVQQCTLTSPLRIRDSRSFLRPMEMNPTVVGDRKDKIFDNVFTNSSSKPLIIESVEFLGEYENEFFLSGGQPPITVAPGASSSIEFSFAPRAAGIRSARVHLRTSIGFVSARLIGVAVNPTVITPSAPIDIGDVSVGEERTISLEPYYTVEGGTKPDVRWVELRGPDTVQFSFTIPEPGGVIAKQPLAAVAAKFSALRTGRTSAQILVHSSADDSPHVLQLAANGVSYQRDVTSFRGICVPTAATLNAGSYSIGAFNLLGVTAAAGITDNIMIHAGGILPVPLGDQLLPAFSIGAKATWKLSSDLRAGIGYQFAESVSDNTTTGPTESTIISHVPYAVVTYGDDLSRISLNMGYALKRHTTIAVPDGFDAPVFYGVVSADMRVSGNWKMAAEIMHAQTLGTIPLAVTARYLGRNFALDAGFVLTSLRTSGAPTASPVYPLLGATWVW